MSLLPWGIWNEFDLVWHPNAIVADERISRLSDRRGASTAISQRCKPQPAALADTQRKYVVVGDDRPLNGQFRQGQSGGFRHQRRPPVAETG